MDEATLLGAARAAMERAYAPYSRFSVGAAVVCRDGSIITGCNVENASYGLSMCAERVALFRAVAEGKRSFCLLAVVAELLDGATPVVLANTSGQCTRTTVAELLPRPFLSNDVKKGAEYE